MKTPLILLVFLSLICLIAVLYSRTRREKDEATDPSWNYTIAKPVIPPDHEASVTFQITPTTQAHAGSQAWLASYSAEGHTARFIIEIEPSNRSETHGILMHFGSGRIVALPGSDNTALLRALAFALDGKIPATVQKRSDLPFEYVHFGDHMALLHDGAYAFNPPGNWTAMKLFLSGHPDDPEDSATVYFGLNYQDGIARLSMSNSDYGDDVLRFLAPIL